MQMTITAHKAITMEEVTCPGCKLPASGQREPGGPCVNCRQVPRVKKTAEMLSAAERLPTRAAVLAVMAIGVLMVIASMWLAVGK